MIVRFMPKFPAEFKNELEAIIDALLVLVPVWCHSITVEYNETEESLACIRVDTEYRRACLTIGQQWAASIEPRIETIAHEFCHFYTAHLGDVARQSIDHFHPDDSPGKKIANDAIYRAVEGATEDLCRLIERLTRGDLTTNEPYTNRPKIMTHEGVGSNP